MTTAPNWQLDDMDLWNPLGDNYTVMWLIAEMSIGVMLCNESIDSFSHFDLFGYSILLHCLFLLVPLRHYAGMVCLVFSNETANTHFLLWVYESHKMSTGLVVMTTISQPCLQFQLWIIFGRPHYCLCSVWRREWRSQHMLHRWTPISKLGHPGTTDIN